MYLYNMFQPSAESSSETNEKNSQLFPGSKTSLTTIDCGSAATSATRPTLCRLTTATPSRPSTETTTKLRSAALVLRPTEVDGGFTGFHFNPFAK